MRTTLPVFAAVLGLAFSATIATAQQEFTPPPGRGREGVAVSGLDTSAYETAARKLAALGYDVFFVDGTKLVDDQGVGLKAAVDKARQSPNALPGKVGVVGFSLGG